MKIRVIYIVGLLLMFFSCTVEEQSHLPEVISRGDGDWYTVQAVVPDNWKIVDAQLTVEWTYNYDLNSTVEEKR